MSWFQENVNLVIFVVFFLTLMFKGKIMALIFRIKNISANDFKQKLNEGNINILDVRTPAEYLQQHIPQAVNVPLNELTNDKLAQLKSKYSGPVYVICASGNRSMWASITLKKKGLDPINVNGGMLIYNRV